MSFLLDPPALVICGVLIDRYVESTRRRTILATAVVGVFYLVSTLLYLDVLPWWWGGWIAGSDWMLNSGLPTNLEPQPGTHVLAVIIFASYPLWMLLGLDLASYGGSEDA